MSLNLKRVRESEQLNKTKIKAQAKKSNPYLKVIDQLPKEIRSKLDLSK